MVRRHGVELGCALAAMVATALLTRHGILLDPDSTTYLRTSQWFREAPSTFWEPPRGTSLSIRGLFPPLYPLALALAGGVGDDLRAARGLGIALAGVAAWCLAFAVRRHAGAATAVAVFAVVACSRAWLLVNFGFLLSEGLFLALALAAVAVLATMVHPLPTRSFWWRAAVVATLGAACFGARYVGLGVVLGLAASLLLVTDQPAGRRVAAAGAALAAGTIPTVMWTSVAGGHGATGDRSLGWRGLGRAELWSVEELPHRFLPRQGIDALGSAGARTLGVLALAALLVWSLRSIWLGARHHAEPSRRAVAGLLLVGWGQLTVLVATRAVVDLLIPLGGRHVMLWFTAVVAAAGIDGHRAWADEARPAWRRPALVGLAAMLVLGSLPAFAQALRDPLGSWSNLAQAAPSPTVDRLADLAPDAVVVTNREDLVYLGTGRATAPLPEPTNRYSGAPNRNFEPQMAAVAERARRGEAIVVAFTDDPVWSLPEGDLRRITGLALVARTDDAVVLAASP